MTESHKIRVEIHGGEMVIVGFLPLGIFVAVVEVVKWVRKGMKVCHRETCGVLLRFSIDPCRVSTKLAGMDCYPPKDYSHRLYPTIWGILALFKVLRMEFKPFEIPVGVDGPPQSVND